MPQRKVTIPLPLIANHEANNFKKVPLLKLDSLSNKSDRIVCFYQSVLSILNDPDALGLAEYPHAPNSTELAYFLACQAAHETGFFTSNVFKSYRNAFGMCKTFSRPDFQSGMSAPNHHCSANGTVGYGTYESVTGSILCRLNRDAYKNIPFTDPVAYLEQLRISGYATDPRYAELVLNIYNTYADSTGVTSNVPYNPDELRKTSTNKLALTGGVILVAIIILYFVIKK